MGTKLLMTTSLRAQADGQTERQHLILEDALRCMVSYHGSDWSDHLSTIEFAHATLVSKSTQLSPFEIETGRKKQQRYRRRLQWQRNEDWYIRVRQAICR